jgi:hypothetical protein
MGVLGVAGLIGVASFLVMKRRGRRGSPNTVMRTLYTVTKRSTGEVQVVGSPEELADEVGAVEAYTYLQSGDAQTQPFGGRVHIQRETRAVHL